MNRWIVLALLACCPREHLVVEGSVPPCAMEVIDLARERGCDLDAAKITFRVGGWDDRLLGHVDGTCWWDACGPDIDAATSNTVYGTLLGHELGHWCLKLHGGPKGDTPSVSKRLDEFSTDLYHTAYQTCRGEP